MLFAEGRGTSLAVASSVPWLARSAGYVGVSDGWHSLSRGEGLRQDLTRAENGNVAISGTLDLAAQDGHAVLAIGFGNAAGGGGAARAAQRAATAGSRCSSIIAPAGGKGRPNCCRSMNRAIPGQGTQPLSGQHGGAGHAPR